jgi:hypothetical protein
VMIKFKVGDRVRFIKAESDYVVSGYIKLDKIYIVKSVGEGYHKDTIGIEGENGTGRWNPSVNSFVRVGSCKHNCCIDERECPFREKAE